MHYTRIYTLLNNNSSAAAVQRQCTITDVLPQNQSSIEVKSVEKIIDTMKQDSFYTQQQDAMFTALFDASAKTSNSNTNDVFKDVHLLRHRFKRQTLSSQSLLSSLGNEK